MTKLNFQQSSASQDNSEIILKCLIINNWSLFIMVLIISVGNYFSWNHDAFISGLFVKLHLFEVDIFCNIINVLLSVLKNY